MKVMRLLVGVFLLLLVLAACREERKVDVAGGLSMKGMPTMKTVNVATLISDSGITRYKIVSPLWEVFDEVDTPYWRFPKGLFLRRYDPHLKVIATVAADSARYLKYLHLWKLDGNVEITRFPGTLFQTQQLFWDERRHRVYSDSFIHIETPSHVIEGHGFESNDQLTDYAILKPEGIFPVDTDAI